MPAEFRGRAHRIYNFIAGAMAIPAGLLTGWTWDAVSPFVVLARGAGIAAASGVLLLALGRKPAHAAMWWHAT